MKSLNKRRIRTLLASLMLFSVAVSAAPPDTASYGDWYQVEIIVFAQKHPSPSDETWSTPNLEYPANMLAIAPRSAKDLEPTNLSELTQMLAASGSEEQQAPGASQTPDTYMFADKSRFQNGPGQANTATAESQQADAAQTKEDAEIEQIFNANLPQAFRTLPRNTLNLNGVARSIERSSLYTLLLHVGWLQPIPENGNSWPVLIQAGDRYAGDYEVDGTLTVSRSRYLHVNTNLWFNQFKKKYDEESPLPPIVTNLDPAVRARYPNLVAAEERSVSFEKVQTYPMKLSRRMRSATLHYLDNPYFGVLIEVDEFNYTPPAGAQSAPTSQ